MDDVPDIATQQEVYEVLLDSDFYYKTFLPRDDTHNPPPEELSADREILAYFEDIRRLKSQLNSLKSYSNFASQIKTKKPVDQLSTPKEAAVADSVLGKEKQVLRSIKRERADADSRLPATVEELFITARKQDFQLARLRHQLLASKAAIHAKEVDAAIAAGNIRALENLVDVIDEVDEESCGKIISFMRKITTLDESDSSQHRTKIGAFRTQLRKRRASLEQRRKKKDALERRIKDLALTIPGVLQAHTESAMDDSLVKVLSAFGGMRVKSMHENGILFSINATIFGSGNEQNRLGDDRFKTTHMLDIVFDPEETSNSVVARGLRVREIVLDSSDVPVSDLNQVPLKWAVREVNSRLFELIESNVEQVY